MSDYADISNLSWDQIQDTKPVPQGSYLLKASNAVFQPSKDEAVSPAVMFIHNVKEAMEDVAVSELEELGADYDVTENKVFTKVFIEDGSSWKKVQRILEAHGLETTGKVLDDLKKVKGAEVIGYLTKDRYTDKRTDEVRENNKVTEWGKVE